MSRQRRCRDDSREVRTIPVMRWTAAWVAKAQRDGTFGVLKGLLGGDGCPWEELWSSCCAALCSRSTAASPAATGATGAAPSSGSSAFSSGASLQQKTQLTFQLLRLYSKTMQYKCQKNKLNTPTTKKTLTENQDQKMFTFSK